MLNQSPTRLVPACVSRVSLVTRKVCTVPTEACPVDGSTLPRLVETAVRRWAVATPGMANTAMAASTAAHSRRRDRRTTRPGQTLPNDLSCMREALLRDGSGALPEPRRGHPRCHGIRRDGTAGLVPGAPPAPRRPPRLAVAWRGVAAGDRSAERGDIDGFAPTRSGSRAGYRHRTGRRGPGHPPARLGRGRGGGRPAGLGDPGRAARRCVDRPRPC